MFCFTLQLKTFNVAGSHNIFTSAPGTNMIQLSLKLCRDNFDMKGPRPDWPSFVSQT